MRQLLIVEDDELFRRSLLKALADYETRAASTVAELRLQLGGPRPDVILLDVMLPDGTGLDALAASQEAWPGVPVIMLTAVEKISTVVEAMRIGAWDYLTKPVDFDALRLAVERAADAAGWRRELENRRLLQRQELGRHRLLGSSAAMERVRRHIEIAAPADTTVLIEGETGTGKELVARGIHAASPRVDEPFVALNCGGIPRELVEAELFGHVRGAFTGADRPSPGKFELAEGGTLFLDEVGELPAESQVKLLRVLEEKEFYPVGARELRRVDVRLLAATNRDLDEKVAEGQFRADLFYRLAVYRIDLPPLRDRPEDVEELAEHFLTHFASRFGRRVTELSQAASRELSGRGWPGNVRELRNAIERAVLACPPEVPVLETTHLSSLPAPGGGGAFRLPPEGLDFEDLECELLRQALKRSGGNKTQAAGLLGLSPPTFYYRLKKFGLDD